VQVDFSMQIDKKKMIKLSISSDPENVSLVGIAVHALCYQLTRNEEHAFQLECALIEILNNIILHGYHNEEDHPIIINWYDEESQIRVEVIDYGQAIEPLVTPELPDLEETHGRGFWIVQACVDRYFYQVTPVSDAPNQSDSHEQEHNVFTLIKHIHEHGH
jgi:stage II sporulation protein AB (anti-sigma F factor)